MESANPAVWDTAQYAMVAYCVITTIPDHMRPSYSSALQAGETTLEAQFREWAAYNIDENYLYYANGGPAYKPFTEADAEWMIHQYVYKDAYIDNSPFTMYGIFRHRESGAIATANLVATPEFHFKAIVARVLNEIMAEADAENAKHPWVE